jgi:tetratricopeptide (TPR) repeat protein
MKSFVCKNTECSAPENKKEKAYPSAMDCPFCDVPLVEIIAFSESELKLLRSLPYVIAHPLKRAIAENHVPTKITLLRDTFLNYLKYLGLITASEFFNSDLKDKKMVALFQQALAEPSFGSWNQYIRETLSYLKENKHHFFCPDLMAYYELVETDKKRKLFKGEIEFIDGNGDVQLKKQEATAIGMLINFRNRYLGHGLTLDEEASKKLWDEYYPIFSLLLDQLNFANKYAMFKHEHGETYLLQTSELQTIEKGNQTSSSVWIESPEGEKMNILPFFVVPGELSLGKEDKEQILTYESYTGKTIKFFSPEGTEKQTSGKVLEKLNLLLRDKQKELPFAPDTFTKEVFLHRIADENKLILDTLTAEKKYIPGVYVHREEMEIKLREWIGARANIFFIAAEAGSGKTNLLIEMQKQYDAQNLSVLFIRAARMEKPSLGAQIAYLLNIQPELSIAQYPSIAGTQANPTFIFIDGLNEALQAESIWQEILNISKISVPGSIKFVVSSRANSSADVNSFAITDADELYIYGEKKEGHTGLSAYAFWLTALNMAEMKNAWQAYRLTHKNKYKPQFSFNDLATFDRSIYNLISNPLVLRIFLETYHNKSLPKKGNKHLNLWQDWLATFSEKEITFLKFLAKAVWDKGENELLLDDLPNNPKLKPFLTSDLINAPYPRLKNLGWISRYTKDFNACLSFTVEGSLLFLLGSQLLEDELNIELDYIKKILDTGTKIQKSGVESFLIQKAVYGDLTLVCNLIDAGEDYHHVCNSAMLLFLKSWGVSLFLEKVFSEPSDCDWQAMLILVEKLDYLIEYYLKKQLLAELTRINNFGTKAAIKIGLKACLSLDEEQAQECLFEIEKNIKRFNKDEATLRDYGKVFEKFGKYDKALDCYQKCLDIKIRKHEEGDSRVAFYHNYIGDIWQSKREYDKALFFHHKSLDIFLKIRNEWHPLVAFAYSCIGDVWQGKKEHDQALEFYQKCLDIRLKTLGPNHPQLATVYNKIGNIWGYKEEFDKALFFHHKSLDIKLNNLGTEHPYVAHFYNNIGITLFNKHEYDKALEYYQKCLDIRLKTLGTGHPDLSSSYHNIGLVWRLKGKYDLALEFYQKCLDIELNTPIIEQTRKTTAYFYIGICYQDLKSYNLAIDAYKMGYKVHKKGGFPFRIAFCYEKLNNLQKAFDYYLQSAEIRNADTDAGPKNEDTIDSIQNAVRIANLIGKENELPEWIKNHSL